MQESRMIISASCHPGEHWNRYSIFNCLAMEEPFQIVNDHTRDSFTNMARSSGNMWSHDRSRQPPQCIADGKRFQWIGDVESTSQSPVTNFLLQRREIDQGSSCDVDHGRTIG